MKRIITILIFILIAVGCSKSLIFRSELINQKSYDQFGNTPQRNFYYPISISDSLVELWRTSGYGSNTNTSVTIYSDILFSPELAGNIVGFNLLNGNEVGAKKEKGEIAHAVVVDRMRIIFCINEAKGNYGRLFFYDFIKGETIKVIEVFGGSSNELIKLNDGIIALSDFGEVVKYDFLGNVIWNTKTKSLTLTDPASNGNMTYFANSKNQVIAVFNSDGKIVFQKEFEHPFESGISIFDEKIYLADNKGKMFCLDEKTGEEIWKFSSSAKVIMTPILDDKNIYFGNLNGDYYSLSKYDGSLNWHTQSNGMFNATGLVFENYLLQPDVNKSLLIINKSNGVIKNRVSYEQRVRMSPVFYRDMIFVGIDHGEIIAYRPEFLK